MEQTNVQTTGPAAGPGAIVEQGIAPDPILQGASEYEVVTVFNPLPVDFIGQVGQSKPVNMPFEIRKDGFTQTISNDENAVRNNYGLNLKNADHPSRLPIVNRILIPSGQTRKLLGNEAQVVVRQLVTEIMQREGKRLMLADPTARYEVEKRIVRGRSTVEDEIGSAPQSVQSQIRESVNKLNEQHNEQEFPGLTNQTTTSSDLTSGNDGDETSTRKGGARGSQPRTA